MSRSYAEGFVPPAKVDPARLVQRTPGGYPTMPQMDPDCLVGVPTTNSSTGNGYACITNKEVDRG